MDPSDEQRAALDLFLQGESMAIDALAGTGKTTTLSLLAAATRRSGKYLAYNKAIVMDVAGRLPERCSASTAHSLAFRAVGHRYKQRLNGPRVKSWEVANALGIDPFVATTTAGSKRLAPGFLAGHVMRALAIFCNSADEAPTVRHFPYIDGIDLNDRDGHRTYVNNNMLSEALEPVLEKAWADLTNTQGVLRFTHDTYLKIYALSHPKIESDYIMLDEAQDCNPVLAQILAEQAGHAQLVLVGDENQQIYAWRGAIDAMTGFDVEHRRALTQTYRFGPEIARHANKILDEIGSPLRVRGLDSIHSTVGAFDGEPNAVLCRTNACAIETVLAAQGREQPVHLVGGGAEVASFARAARDLQEQGRTSHYELACFDSWDEVQRYVSDDPDGGELALLVRLIDSFGAAVILSAVDGTSPEGPGVLTVSTGHKAKGREWDVVRIAGDFADREATVEELRLRYVAFTRAKRHLDESVFRRV